MNPAKSENAITWLQISDLHAFESSATPLLRQSIREHFHDQVDFLLVTGDLHQYEDAPASGIGNYERTIAELDSLMDAVGLTDKRNLFMIPGNHDAVTSDEKKARSSALDEACWKNPDGFRSYLDVLEPSFATYEAFVHDFYGADVFYGSRSIRNHTQLWNDTVELLHLNTALSCDGDNRRPCIVNLLELSALTRQKPEVPLIVLAHHSFYDVHKNQQPNLRTYLENLNAAVWLCGDYHREVREALSLSSRSIPLFVCGKSAVDPADSWSHIGVILYRWRRDEPGWPVEVHPYRWNGQNPRLEPTYTFVETPDLLRCEREGKAPYYEFYLKKDESSQSSPAPPSLQELGEETERRINGSPLFPWMSLDSPAFSWVHQKLYVEPRLRDQSSGGDTSLSALLSPDREHQKLWLLGDAGLGKSTLLKYLFLENRKHGIPSLYIPATELFQTPLTSRAVWLQALLKGNTAVPAGFRLFLDGIDEAFASRLKELPLFLKQAEALSCELWLGCRSQFFDQAVRESWFQRIVLQTWTEKQIAPYASRYFEGGAESRQYQTYLHLYQTQPYLQTLMKNPFHLSMLLFLIKNRGDRISIDNLYALYDEFFKQWLTKESLRSTGEAGEEAMIYEELQVIARSLYDGEETVTTANPAILSLLITSHLDDARNTVHAFYHRSFMEFLLARAVIEAMSDGPDRLIEVLRKNHRSDVDGFIKAFFKTAQPARKARMIETMIRAYWRSKERGTALTEAEHFYVENQIVYYITRIPGKSTPAQDFIKEIYHQETQAIMRQGIAYGAANMGLLEIGLEFARKMKPDSDEDRTNRAWTLVFYGDMPYEDPLVYEDDGTAPWNHSREARLRRLQASDNKSRAFRMFDLRILLGFFESRHWQDLSQKELDLIRACETDIPDYPADVTAFLAQAKKELIAGYEAHLPPPPPQADRVKTLLKRLFRRKTPDRF